MNGIHYHYDQLSDEERAAVNEVTEELRQSLRAKGFSTPNDDRCEVMVDAVAKLVIAGRELSKSKSEL